MQTSHTVAILLCLALSTPSSSDAAPWWQFRGPGGVGTSSQPAPTRWSSQDNIRWRAELPGPGTSSPIVVGDRIYLTSYTGYGLDASDPGDMARLVRHLVVLHRETGELLLSRPFPVKLPESRYSGGNNARHGYSSSTPVSDGERLYLFFGRSGVYCLDLSGEVIWHESAGDKTTGWGSSNSPVLFQDLLIVNASVESGALVAFNKWTGQTVWSAEGMQSSWNTPALVTTSTGETELVVNVVSKLLGFDPANGQNLWRCRGIPTYVCPSVVSDSGVAYVTGGRGTQYTMAVRAGGRGDVSETHLRWRVPRGSNVSSPVFHRGQVFVMNDSRGIAYCFDADDGRIAYQQRLATRPGRVYASPLAAGDHVYYVSQHKGTFVLAAKPSFELVSHNVFEDDDSRSNASLVAHNGELLLRNDRYLYCIGE